MFLDFPQFFKKEKNFSFRSCKLKSDIYFLQIRPKEGKDEAASKPIHTGATRNVTTNMRNLNFVSPTYSPLVAATLTPTTTLTTTWTPRRSLRRATSRRRSSRGWAAATSTGGSTTARAAPASATCTTTNPSHPRTHFKLSIRSSGRTPPATSSFIQVGFSNIQKTIKSMFRRTSLLKGNKTDVGFQMLVIAIIGIVSTNSNTHFHTSTWWELFPYLKPICDWHSCFVSFKY